MSGVHPDASVLASGRACVVYDLHDGTVLRRYHDPTVCAEREAEVMRLAAAAGVPVPSVRTAAGPDIRMDRVTGPTMLTALVERPAEAGRYGPLLAELHSRLDRVRPPGAAPGHGLIHGDLHPGNVVLSATGPVLLDWTNHRFAPRALDLAITWLILACFDPADDDLRERLRSVRRPLVNSFLSSIDVHSAAAALDDAAAIRHADPATSSVEHARIDRLLDQVTCGSAPHHPT